jgi:hypothetical protein
MFISKPISGSTPGLPAPPQPVLNSFTPGAAVMLVTPAQLSQTRYTVIDLGIAAQLNLAGRQPPSSTWFQYGFVDINSRFGETALSTISTL